MNFKASIRKTFDSGSVKAIADVLIDNELAVHGVKIVEGKNGLFVSMPSEKWKSANNETKRLDIVHPLNSAVRANFNKAVTDAYTEHIRSVKSEKPQFECTL